MTIEALVILVRHCPKLPYIELNFNASLLGRTFPQHRPGHGFSNSLIHTLHVQRSRLENPWLVAAYLSDIFPNLKTIVPAGDSRDADLWQEVAAAIPLFSAAAAWHTASTA